MIEVTIEWADRRTDLLVPTGVSFARLADLLRKGFAAKGRPLPDAFSLDFLDKAVAAGPADLVSAFGIANGDRVRIRADEQEDPTTRDEGRVM